MNGRKSFRSISFSRIAYNCTECGTTNIRDRSDIRRSVDKCIECGEPHNFTWVAQ